MAAVFEISKGKEIIMEPASSIEPALLADICQLIDSAHQQVAAVVNAELTMLYWQVGHRVHNEILQGQRAEYGKHLVILLPQQLTAEYGKGWGEKHLRHCIHLAEIFNDSQILYTLCRELSWSHLRLIMFVADSIKRDFYIELC